MKNNHKIEDSTGSYTEVRDNLEYYWLLFEGNERILYKIVEVDTKNLTYYNTNLDGGSKTETQEEWSDGLGY